MEAQIAALDQELIPGLSYKLPSAAGFISERHNSTFFPEGGNQYAPNGVRVIRFTLAGDTYLDPSSVALSFTLSNNDGGNPLNFVSQNPLILFQRLRLLVGGTLVEDWQYYGRVCHMLNEFMPLQKRLAHHALGGLRKPSNQQAQWSSVTETEEIAASASRKVICPITCGLFAQHLYLPLKYAPVTIELELQSSGDVVVSGGSSEDWTLSDVRVLGDTVHLDGVLEEKVNKHLLSGAGLPLHLNTWNTTMNVVSPSHTSGTFAVQIARAFSRVKTFVATFMAQNDGNDSQLATAFSHPMRSATYVPGQDTLEWTVHIGAHKWPSYPVRSVAESAYHLLKALNLTSAHEGLGFDPSEFTNSKFFMALDLEKAATGPGGGAEFTGLSTRGGETIRFEVKGINASLAADAPNKCFISLQHSVVCVIKAEGVEVFD